MQLNVAMRSALSLARKGLGSCYPNPSVGCVILDKNNNLIGLGSTSVKGRPHAEESALNSLIGNPKGKVSISPGMILIFLGSQEQLNRIRVLFKEVLIKAT